MYDLSGLYYMMKSEIIIFGTSALLFLICSKFWVAEKRKTRDFQLGIFCCILCIGSIVYNGYVISSLHVLKHEGYYITERRQNPYLFRKEYVFSNDDGLKPRFFLDIFSKKNIYSDEFEKEKLYRIYYEEKTNIIVKIEKLE